MKKTEFEGKHRFDQCGIVMYLDSENWIKGSIEYENEEFQHLGSVVTNNGFSDWATTEIGASIKSMWYRFSRRDADYCIECSTDGVKFSQMRICHMTNAKGTIRFGLYACSPEDSSFKATFTNMEMTECKWLAHNGQAPDDITKTMPDCIFCNKDNITTDFVYEDDLIMAFMDMDPINEGHVLLVPKDHYLDVDEMPDEVLSHLTIASKKIVSTLKEVYHPDGYSIMQNGGEFNDIGHYHLHIFPRYKDDGFGWTYGSDAKDVNAETAKRIKEGLN